MRALLAVFVAVLAAACIAPRSFAGPKTDIVVLRNGDRITGEVKGLEQGRLKYSTDSVGTIYIEWEDIASLYAPKIFEIETAAGDIYHGSIGPGPDADSFVLTEGEVTRTIPFKDLVRVFPVGQSWSEGIDGSLSLGLSYVASTELGQLNLSGNAIQRLSNKERQISLAATVTREPEQEDSTRYSAGFTQRWLMAHRRYWWVTLGASSNDEIGLRARGLLSGGIGFKFLQSYHSKLMGFAGLAVGREKPTGDEPSQTTYEGVLGGAYSVATYDFPKTKINVALSTYPGISPSGRLRAMLDGSFSRELFRDFTWGITVYDDYDSDPLDVDAKSNDYGVTMTVGWDF